MMTKQHKSLALLIGVGAVGAYFGARFIAGQAAKKAAAVGNAINPVNDENVFYSGVNSVGGSLTGDKYFTLGGWIYEKLNGEG